MAMVIDANMKLFAERLHISSHRMIQDYGLSTIEQIIEKETERGNIHALEHAREYHHSPEKLIKMFRLNDIENKFVLIHKMDPRQREKVLPMLNKHDMVMGLYFFTQDALLEMLKEADISEILPVILEAFPLEQIVMMFPEEDLAEFFMNDDLDKKDVIEQLKALPPDVMLKFVEGVTGMPSDKTNPMELIQSVDQLPPDDYKKFMAAVDPDVQRQLTFQLTKTKPEYLALFNKETYIDMLNTLMKPDMVKPMIMLDKDRLTEILTKLPPDLMSIVAAQVDTEDLAIFLQKGTNIDFLQQALMI